MHAVENQDTIEVDSDDIFAVDDTEAAEKKALPFLNKEFNEKVIIFDAMGILQSMEKTPAMKVCHLKTAFIKRIKHLMIGYSEGRVLFD